MGADRGKLPTRRARFLVRCSCVASGVVVFLVVRVGLVSVWLSGWSRPRCLLWWWPWGLFPSLLTIQGGRLSCRSYGFAGYVGGCPVWVPRFCLWWFRRSVRVVPRSFLLPFVWVSGRCLVVGSFRGRWFGCLWCGSVVSFQDCTCHRFLCRCLVWVCLLWARLVWVWCLGVGCGSILHPSKDPTFCTRFQIVTKEKTKKAKETENNS